MDVRRLNWSRNTFDTIYRTFDASISKTSTGRTDEMGSLLHHLDFFSQIDPWFLWSAGSIVVDHFSCSYLQCTIMRDPAHVSWMGWSAALAHMLAQVGSVEAALPHKCTGWDLQTMICIDLRRSFSRRGLRGGSSLKTQIISPRMTLAPSTRMSHISYHTDRYE